MSTGDTADYHVHLIVLFYFNLLSNISAWIEALRPGNQLELTGILSNPISSYPK